MYDARAVCIHQHDETRRMRIVSSQHTSRSSPDKAEVQIPSHGLERNQFVDHMLALLGDRSRRSIVGFLAVSPNASTSLVERRSGEIAHLLGISAASTSEHLRLLAQAGLVSSRQEGTSVYYRLGNQPVVQAFQQFLHAIETDYSTQRHLEGDMPFAPQRAEEHEHQATVRKAEYSTFSVSLPVETKKQAERRIIPRSTFTGDRNVVVARDLERYYEGVLKVGLKTLRNANFSPEERACLATLLSHTDCMDPDSISLLLCSLEDSVAEMCRFGVDPDTLLTKLHTLDTAALYALVDVIERDPSMSELA